MRLAAVGFAIWSVSQVVAAFRGYKERPFFSVVYGLMFAWFGLKMAAIALNTAGPLGPDAVQVKLGHYDIRAKQRLPES